MMKLSPCVVSLLDTDLYKFNMNQVMFHKHTNLNGKYASFGYVIAGMEVVDAIAAVETNASDKPLTDVVIEKIEITYSK